MKPRYVITAVLISLPMILSPANAGEKNLNKDQAPKEVIAAFEKAYPHAKGLKF